MTLQTGAEHAVADLERLCDNSAVHGFGEIGEQDIADMRALIADWRDLRHRVDVIENPTPITGTGMPGTIYLDLFGHWLRQAFPSSTAVHVGSSAVSKTWRDVDVRLVMPDEDFDALFPNGRALHQNDVRWALLSAAIAELGKKLTGFPIDFQFQRRSEASERYGKKLREPLDLYGGHADTERC